MEIKDLKEGEIYNSDCNNENNYNGSYLFMYNSTLNKYNYIGYNYSINTSEKAGNNFNKLSYHGWKKDIKLATPEQKHWLNECIKADKYISYEEAMKTFVKEFVLPEKWCIERTPENYKIINQWCNDNLLPGEEDDYIDKHSYIYSESPHAVMNYYKRKSYITQRDETFREITFDQFKQYVLKEKKVPYEILKQEDDRIIQVANSEGNIFEIGDTVIVTVGKYKPITPILSFRISKEGRMLAITRQYKSNGINIDKIEHYIEPKVEVKEEFTLPTYWWIRPTNEEELKVVKDFFRDKFMLNVNTSLNVHIGQTFGYIRSFYRGYYLNLVASTLETTTQLTFDQFKEYVVGIKPEVVKPIAEEVKQDHSKFEILSLYNLSDDRVLDDRNNIRAYLDLSNKGIWLIRSVKQLSTGKVFTVDDQVSFIVSSYITDIITDQIVSIKLSENNNIVFELAEKGTIMMKNCI